MNHTLVAVVLTMAAYLVGSIPSGLILAKLFTGRDVRDAGSGNIGAANISRIAGFRVAIFVLVFDMAKGFVPVILGRISSLDPTQLAVIAGAAVIGHDFSIFLRFHGGKGVATTLGIALGLATLPGSIAAGIWVSVLGVTRYSSISSLIALAMLPITMAAFNEPAPFVALGLGLFVLGIFTHRENILRLSNREESRIGTNASR